MWWAEQRDTVKEREEGVAVTEELKRRRQSEKKALDVRTPFPHFP